LIVCVGKPRSMEGEETDGLGFLEEESRKQEGRKT
jgi:hypothetical protein